MMLYYFPEVRQDTLVRPQQSQPSITVRRPQLDLERAGEVMRQFEQREQEFIESQQRRVARPKPVEALRAPSIEVDTLLDRYRHIGCSPRPHFPDTFTLTVLERYYQPMAPAVAPDSLRAPVFATDTLMALQDSASAIIPVTVAEPPAVRQGFASENRPGGYPSSVTLFIIGGWILLAFIKYQFGKNLWEAFLAFFSYRRAERIYEERRESARQTAVLSNILFAWAAGIFISIALPFFDTDLPWGNYTWSIPFFSLATGILYLLKSWIWKTLGEIFMVQPLCRTYLYNMYMYNCNIGWMILPLVTVIPYIAQSAVPCLVYGAITVVAVAYLFKLRRVFQIIQAQRIPVFYFILYLCTLEISPLLLLIKGCELLREYVSLHKVLSFEG